MKKLLKLLGIFFVGQAVILYKKDPKLQKKIETTRDYPEKAKILLQNLFVLNKDLVQKARSRISEKSLETWKKELSLVTIKIESFLSNYIQGDKTTLQEKYKELASTYPLQNIIKRIGEVINPYLHLSEKKVLSKSGQKKKL